MAGFGAPELLIILAVVLLLFGGSRLAGLGKSTGRALKEFKEETRGLGKGEDKTVPPAASPVQTYESAAQPYQTAAQPPQVSTTTSSPEAPVHDPATGEPRRDA